MKLIRKKGNNIAVTDGGHKNSFLKFQTRGHTGTKSKTPDTRPTLMHVEWALVIMIVCKMRILALLEFYSIDYKY